MTILFGITCVMDVRNQSIQAFVTSFGPFCDRPSLFPGHRISGLPTRAKYKHFRTISDDTFDNSPQDFNSSSLHMMVINARS